MAFEQGEGRRTAIGDDHLVAGVLEHALDEPPDAVLVLDDRHGLAAARRTLELDPLVLRRSARDIRLPVTADESLVAADAG